MKTKQIICSLMTAGVLFFAVSGCSKESKEEMEPDTEKPVMRNLVIGAGNSKTVQLGEKLIVEGDIVAKGKISRVLISMNSLDAPIPVGISTTLERDLKDKTEAKLKWETKIDNVATGRYRLTITIEAKAGEPGQVISEVNVLPK